MNNYISYLTNWFLFIAGLINIILGTYSAYQSHSSVATICLVSGLVFLFSANIDKFESLKGLGIEAKTKQLDQKLHEADEALDYLRNITEFTAKTLVEIQTKIGRWNGGPSSKELIEFGEEIRRIMTTTGSSEISIQNVLKPWAKTLCMDLGLRKVKNLSQIIDDKIKEIQLQINSISQPITLPNQDYETLLQYKRTLTDFKISKIDKIYMIPLEEYPESLLDIYDSVPIIPQNELEALRLDISEFSEEIRALKTSKQINDKFKWIRALE